jgi:hypothetical protein
VVTSELEEDGQTLNRLRASACFPESDEIKQQELRPSSDLAREEKTSTMNAKKSRVHQGMRNPGPNPCSCVFPTAWWTFALPPSTEDQGETPDLIESCVYLGESGQEKVCSTFPSDLHLGDSGTADRIKTKQDTREQQAESKGLWRGLEIGMQHRQLVNRNAWYILS